MRLKSKLVCIGLGKVLERIIFTSSLDKSSIFDRVKFIFFFYIEVYNISCIVTSFTLFNIQVVISLNCYIAVFISLDVKQDTTF